LKSGADGPGRVALVLELTELDEIEDVVEELEDVVLLDAAVMEELEDVALLEAAVVLAAEVLCPDLG